MNSYNDHITLQLDIDYLHNWCLNNKMKFHPSKCKVLMVSKFNPPLVDVLPFLQFYYTMGGDLLQYTDTLNIYFCFQQYYASCLTCMF